MICIFRKITHPGTPQQSCQRITYHIITAVKDMKTVISSQIQVSLIFNHCVIRNLRQHRHGRNIRKPCSGNMQCAAVRRNQPVASVIILHDLLDRRFEQTSLHFMEDHVPIKESQAVAGADQQTSGLVLIQAAMIFNFPRSERFYP